MKIYTAKELYELLGENVGYDTVTFVDWESLTEDEKKLVRIERFLQGDPIHSEWEGRWKWVIYDRGD